MAYAGIQTMLLAYKMQKSDKEFQLMQITNQLTAATKDSSALSENRDAKLSELSKDDPNYEAYVDEIDEEYKNDLADIAAWEDELQQKQSDCNTQISLLDGYINTWTTALQQNIGKSHKYGNIQ